jgi:NAD(P)-dependent dehydrogenase (short-subunit alcohol dehydrogenase family)
MHGFPLNGKKRFSGKNEELNGVFMQYFVTGATGFIGKRLVKKLLERKGSVVYFLIRKESEARLQGAARVLGRWANACIPVFGRPD